jgi:plastocyanin
LRQPLGAALACALALALGGGAAVGTAAAATTHTVVIEAVSYKPETLTVNRGDTVIWVNKDPFPHTVTAKGLFDSHSIDAGKSWKYTTKKAGEFSYICTFHPNMKGTLTVK